MVVRIGWTNSSTSVGGSLASKVSPQLPAATEQLTKALSGYTNFGAQPPTEPVEARQGNPCRTAHIAGEGPAPFRPLTRMSCTRLALGTKVEPFVELCCSWRNPS